MKTPGVSIFSRLLVAFLGGVIVISGLLTEVFYVFSAGARGQQVDERLLQQLVSIDQSIRYQFGETLRRDLSVLAANPLLDEFIMSPHIEKEILSKSVERLFLQALAYTPSYQSVAFVNALGNEEVRVDRAGRVRIYRSLRNDPLFEQLRSGAQHAIASVGPYVRDDGEVLCTIGIQKIDGDIGKFGGAVIVTYNLQDFFAYLDKRRIFGEQTIWVFGPTGEVLRQPPAGPGTFDPRPFLSPSLQLSPHVRSVAAGRLAYQDWFLGPRAPQIRVAISVSSALVLKDIGLAK